MGRFYLDSHGNVVNSETGGIVNHNIQSKDALNNIGKVAPELHTRPIDDSDITKPMAVFSEQKEGNSVSEEEKIIVDLKKNDAKPQENDPEQTRALKKYTTRNSANTVKALLAGWLVIIEGAGKGESVSIGYGANTIGRDNTQNIALNFGDSTISRDTHCVIVFDPKSRKFYLSVGAKRQIIYINDDIVLNQKELSPRDIIEIGETKLLFMPLCGDDYIW